MAATDLQRIWRLPALAAALVVSGCKDLMPTYMGGDVGVASLHGSGLGTAAHAQGRRASAVYVSSTHAIVAAKVRLRLQVL